MKKFLVIIITYLSITGPVLSDNIDYKKTILNNTDMPEVFWVNWNWAWGGVEFASVKGTGMGRPYPNSQWGRGD